MNKLFPNASKAIKHALEYNEAQHGKGVHLKDYEYEFDKGSNHLVCASHGLDNEEDGTTHLCSAVIRLLKALEIQEANND